MSTEHTENNMAQIDLRILLTDLFRVAKRVLWLAVLLVVIACAFFVWRTHSTYHPLYRATASFTVSVTNPLYSSVRTYNASAAEQMEKTFPYILTSGALSDVVKEQLGLDVLPSISASVLENTNIFTLAVTSDDPQLAYDVLGAVIECYPSVAEFVVGPTEMSQLDESGVPTEPINSKNYVSAVKRGVLVGAALWAVIVLLLAMTRTTIHNEKELEQLVNLRCLGMLPMTRRFRKDKNGTACPLLTRENDNYGFGESVRLLRIRAEKEMREQGQKVLLVTSAIPGEGKTTVAANLAIALAHKGKKTLLVDCDLRNPSVAAVFGKENGKGFSDYLKGKAEAGKVIQPLETENLFAAFGGTPVANASELLAQEKTRGFIEDVQGRYDYIILDTPPSSLLADAAELARLADCAVMVIRQNFASRSQILDGVQLLSDGGIPLIGCVLNGVGRGLLKGSSSYYGYYGYGGKYRSYGTDGPVKD